MKIDPLVIDVFTAGNESYVRVDSSSVPVSRDATRLAVRMVDVPFNELRNRPVREGLVRECGDKLCTSLVSNQGVQDTLDRFKSPPQDTRHPIYVSISQPEHENLPWEAIWRDTVEFFALGPQWPIARLASASDDTSDVERTIGDVPRIMAIIAAEDANVDGEWNGFETLLDTFADKIEIQVLLASDDLKARIEARDSPRVQCLYVGQSATDIIRQIRLFAPNVVHFFCHGTSQNGGSLSVINRLGETVQIRREDLLPLRQLESLCLVVLNCCRGGQADPADHASSIARELVKAGLPAVVAMREIITDVEANAFTRAFYGELLLQLRACFGGAAAEADAITVPDETWLDALLLARQALKPQTVLPANALEWTLPMIYVRRGGLRFRRVRQDDPRRATKADVLRTFLEQLRAHPATPPALLQELEQQLARE